MQLNFEENEGAAAREAPEWACSCVYVAALPPTDAVSRRTQPAAVAAQLRLQSIPGAAHVCLCGTAAAGASHCLPALLVAQPIRVYSCKWSISRIACCVCGESRFFLVKYCCTRVHFVICEGWQVLRNLQSTKRGQVRKIRQVVLQRAHHRHSVLYCHSPGAHSTP